VRARAFFVAFSVGASLAAAAACGIDETGLVSDASTDATAPKDVVVADVPEPMDVQIDVPQACSTLDASACVDAALPSGWTYLVAAQGDASCPTGDYEDEVTYATAPVAAGNACTCTCTPSGSYSCAGAVSAGSGGATCNVETYVFDAGDDASCPDPRFNSPYVSVGPTPAPTSVDASCATNDTGSHAFTTSTATGCTPGCAADYCNVGDGFARCIVTTSQSPTLQACPAPFTHGPIAVGAAGNVAVACSGCQCAASPAGPCTAAVTPYSSDDCSGTAVTNGAIPADASCATATGVVDSFLYVPTAPQATCVVTASGVGAARFSQSLTLCCLP